MLRSLLQYRLLPLSFELSCACSCEEGIKPLLLGGPISPLFVEEETFLNFLLILPPPFFFCMYFQLVSG
jgi:hypothetical protein